MWYLSWPPPFSSILCIPPEWYYQECCRGAPLSLRQRHLCEGSLSNVDLVMDRNLHLLSLCSLGPRLLFQRLAMPEQSNMTQPSSYGFTILVILLTNALLKLMIIFMPVLFIHWASAILSTMITWSWGWTKSSQRMLRPSCVSYCTVAWTGVCLRGAWMIASVGVCVSVRMRFVSSVWWMLCLLEWGVIQLLDGPQFFGQLVISLQLRGGGGNYHTHQLCFGNCSGPGIWRARIFLRPEQHGCPIGNVCEMVTKLAFTMRIPDSYIITACTY